MDLHRALCEDWSPSRSDFAIKRFRKLCEALDFDYSEKLTDRFMEYTDEFFESLIIGSLFIDGGYDSLYEDRTQKERFKSILKNIGLFYLVKKVYKLLISNNQISDHKTEVFLSDGNDFIIKAKAYLEKVLFSNTSSELNTVISNNAFEPFNPQKSIRIFNNAYAIIVDRDPRDIYASVMGLDETFLPHFETDEGLFTADYLQQLKEDMLGADDIQSFIKRQRLYREKMQIEKDNPRVVYVNYEDLVLNYEETVQEILSKVGIDSHLHTKKKHYFDPEQSSKNVGLWKQKRDSEDIKLIEKELKKYIYT
jgi:hypothetical protein